MMHKILVVKAIFLNHQNTVHAKKNVVKIRFMIVVKNTIV